MPLQADGDGELAFLRLFGRLEHSRTPGVHRHRLLHEDVLARLHRRLEVLRTKSGRGGQNDHIDVALEHAW
jgi:hypothetical protein